MDEVNMIKAIKGLATFQSQSLDNNPIIVLLLDCKDQPLFTIVA